MWLQLFNSAQNVALLGLIFDGPEPQIGIIINFFLREVATFCMGGSNFFRFSHSHIFRNRWLQLSPGALPEGATLTVVPKP